MEQNEIESINQRLTRLETMHLYGSLVIVALLGLYFLNKYDK